MFCCFCVFAFCVLRFAFSSGRHDRNRDLVALCSSAGNARACWLRKYLCALALGVRGALAQAPGVTIGIVTWSHYAAPWRRHGILTSPTPKLGSAPRSSRVAQVRPRHARRLSSAWHARAGSGCLSGMLTLPKLAGHEFALFHTMFWVLSARGRVRHPRVRAAPCEANVAI